MINDFEHLFIYLLAIHMTYLEITIQILGSFFSWIVCFPDAQLYNFLAILHINTLLIYPL